MLPGKTYTPEELLRLAWRRKWIIVIPFVLVTSATVIGLRYLPDWYRSETLILVVPQRVPDSYVRATVTSRIEDRLQSISQQILSRSRLEPIINEFNLYAESRQVQPMEDVVARMRRDIDAAPVRGDAFRVSYVSQDPEAAQKVTERLATLFIDENLRDRGVLAEATNEFLDSQLQEARDRLIQHEKRLESYRLRYSGELPTQAGSNIQTLQMLQVQVQGLTDSAARDRDRRLNLERQLAEMQRQSGQADEARKSGEATPPPADDQAPSGSMREQLAQARRQLEALETRLKPEHPDVVRAKRLIRELETSTEVERKAAAAAAAAAIGTSTPSPASSAGERALMEVRSELANVNREISGKEASLTKLQAEIEVYRGRLDAVPTRESEMTELMRDYETLRGVYTDLLAKRENSKVAANLERRQIGEQFRVIDPARRPEVPFSPNRQLYRAGGAGLGLSVGLLLVVLLEVRDRTFRSSDDITVSLRLPVLATVPRMMNTAEVRRERVRSLVLSGVAVVAGVGLAAAIGFWQ